MINLETNQKYDIGKRGFFTYIGLSKNKRWYFFIKRNDKECILELGIHRNALDFENEIVIDKERHYATLYLYPKEWSYPKGYEKYLKILNGGSN